MKKVNNSLLKSFNVILVALLGLLGFSGCDKTIEAREEYGTPQTDYFIKGKVLDKATGKTISGIKIQLYDNRITAKYGVPTTDYNRNIFYKIVDTTDISGDYLFGGSSAYGINEIKTIPYAVGISDIDGAENGTYNDTIIDFDLTDAVQSKKGNGHWYDGEYTKTINVELPRNNE
ncbi:hypothetical protein FACS189434_12110 [Bacteroidia bacterium]|nr:hypothetical protein FACS189434_12110 [Bacteroidia bacterium]